MRGIVAGGLVALVVLGAGGTVQAALPTHLSDWGITPWANWAPGGCWNSADGIALYHVSDSWFGPNAEAPGAAWRHRGTLDKLPNPTQWSKVGYAWDPDCPTSPNDALADGFNWSGTDLGGAGGEGYDLEGLYLTFGRDPVTTAITSLDYALVDGWTGAMSAPSAVDVYRHIPVIGLDFGTGGLYDNAGGSYHYALALAINDEGTMAFTAKDANREGTTNNSRFRTGNPGDQYLERAGLFRVADNGADLNPGDWISTDDDHAWQGWAGVDGDKHATISSHYQDTAIAWSTEDAGFEYLGEEGGAPAYLWTGSINLTDALASNDPLWSWLKDDRNSKWWTARYTYWSGDDRLGGGRAWG